MSIFRTLEAFAVAMGFWRSTVCRDAIPKEDRYQQTGEAVPNPSNAQHVYVYYLPFNHHLQMKLGSSLDFTGCVHSQLNPRYQQTPKLHSTRYIEKNTLKYTHAERLDLKANRSAQKAFEKVSQAVSKMFEVPAVCAHAPLFISEHRIHTVCALIDLLHSTASGSSPRLSFFSSFSAHLQSSLSSY